MGTADGPSTPDPAARYEIHAWGQLDESWSEWFGGLSVERQGDVTILSGLVADQAALRGILSRLWDLQLTLLSVVRVDRGVGKQGR